MEICKLISEMNDANKNLISATRICTSIYLIMTFRSDNKSQVSYTTVLSYTLKIFITSNQLTFCQKQSRRGLVNIISFSFESNIIYSHFLSKNCFFKKDCRSGVTTPSIMPLSITTFGIMPLNIICSNTTSLMTLSINDTQPK